jgi:hypothetical protein
MILDRDAVVRIANNKPTRFKSSDIKTVGIDLVGYKLSSKRRSLSDHAYEMNIEFAVLVALVMQESNGVSFRYGMPVLLFEAHVFERCLRKAGFSSSELIANNSRLADIIRVSPYRKYGSFRKQLNRYKLAKRVDSSCAICACSWGKFQVLGENWEMVGEESPQSFLESMGSEEGQLDIFIKYVKAKKGLVDALQNKDWMQVKRLYQGKRSHDRDGDGEDDYVASLVRHYTRAVQRDQPRKPLSKSRTMRSNATAVGAKIAAGAGVLYNSESVVEMIGSVNGKLAELAQTKEMVSSTVSKIEELSEGISVTNGLLSGYSWIPYAIVILLIVAIYPHVRVAISYMIDNGYLSDGQDDYR